MATLVNTLYPPTVDTFQKAFVNTTDAVVYFTLSSFNSPSEIKHVHVTCVNQLNNENALNKLSGVLIEDLMYDKDCGMYYVTIPTAAMANNQFNTNQFYKVQIRFDAYDGTDVPIEDEKRKNEYLLSYQQYFSEWSSVCLIRPIQEPQIRLNMFDNYTGNKLLSLSAGLVNVTGGITFESNTEVETLQSYKIDILLNKEIVLSSPTLYTADSLDPNLFSYNMDLSSLKNEEGEEFTMRLTIRTKNQYQSSKEYDFQLNNDLPDDGGWNPTITAELDDETASVTITVSNTNAFATSQILYISRASSADNFKTWENLYVGYIQDITGSNAKMIVDNTINSFVWYRYRAQLQNISGLFYPRKTHDITSVILPQFEDAFLTRGDTQYDIRYDYKVSSWKPVVNRAKIDTLGGKYPKFAENAVLNYKQFNITGTITAESDVYQEFLTKSSIYTDKSGLSTFYTAYKSSNGIKDIVRNDVKNYEKKYNSSQVYPKVDMPDEASQMYVTTTENDIMWEREFREHLISWLNDGEPKLFRSPNEGSMVVMLTDINITPNQVIDHLCSFSATMYEIGEASSLDNLVSLGIYNGHRLDSISGSGDIDPDDEPKEYLEVIAPGQIHQWTVDTKNDIRDKIQEQLNKKYSGVLATHRPFDIILKDVKIYFHNSPNAYYFESTGSGTPQKVELPNSTSDRLFFNDLLSNKRIVRGYAFSFISDASNGTIPMFVNERGYYQFPSNVSIKSLSFDNIGDVVTIEYTICYKTENAVNTVISGSSVDSDVVGQLRGSFSPYHYLGSDIKSKYNYISYSGDVADYQKQMKYWRGMCLDVTPYAMFNIKYHDESNYNTYEVGGTGVFHFLKNVSVDDICFIGRRMKRVDISRAKFMRDWEYALDASVLGNSTISQQLNWFTIYNIDTTNPVTVYQNSEAGNDKIVPTWIAVQDTGTVGKDAYQDISAIQEPMRNVVYNINGKLKIYYNDGEWYDFQLLQVDNIDNNVETNTVGLAAVPIQGIVSYSGQVLVTSY